MKCGDANDGTAIRPWTCDTSKFTDVNAVCNDCCINMFAEEDVAWCKFVDPVASMCTAFDNRVLFIVNDVEFG